MHGYIDDALRLLEREGMVAMSGEVAHPVRRHTKRAKEIIAAGALSKDPLVREVLGAASA